MDGSAGHSIPSQHRSEGDENPTKVGFELPIDLLSLIAQRLGIIELLSFRGVCKDWNFASSTASAEVESLPLRKPWFLLYGETSTCSLVSDSGKKYSINLPELDGATCIASNYGWLLLLEVDSIYFFCPFSHARIDLPNLPNLTLYNCIATFSSLPTSADCIVSVVCQDEGLSTKLHLISRGATVWTTYEDESSLQWKINTIKSAKYHEGVLYFMDEKNRVLTFDVTKKDWKLYRVVTRSIKGAKAIPFNLKRKNFMEKNMKETLGLEGDISITTCGTAVTQQGYDEIVFNESIEAFEESKSRHLKGVWIHPRFFQVAPNQSW